MSRDKITEQGRQIGRNIYGLLVEKGKTQDGAAREMGVSKSALNGWVVGRRIPRMDNIDTMCAYFKCTRTRIIEGKDPEAQFHLTNGAIIEIKPTGFYEKDLRLSAYDQKVVESLVETLLNKKEK